MPPLIDTGTPSGGGGGGTYYGDTDDDYSVPDEPEVGSDSGSVDVGGGYGDPGSGQGDIDLGETPTEDAYAGDPGVIPDSDSYVDDYTGDEQYNAPPPSDAYVLPDNTGVPTESYFNSDEFLTYVIPATASPGDFAWPTEDPGDIPATPVEQPGSDSWWSGPNTPSGDEVDPATGDTGTPDIIPDEPDWDGDGNPGGDLTDNPNVPDIPDIPAPDPQAVVNGITGTLIAAVAVAYILGGRGSSS